MLAVLGACILAGTVGVTFGAFSSQTSTVDHTFSAANAFGVQMSSGWYQGDGVDNRTISAPAFQPDLVIVKDGNNQVAVARTSTMSGDVTKVMAGTGAPASDRIQSFVSNGFTIGRHATVNSNGEDYSWSAFKATAGVMQVGSYTGNGGASRAITGVGFSPELVMIFPAASPNANLRFAGMSRAYRFDSETGATDRITSLDSDGFSISSDDETNTSGAVYHWVAFNEMAGAIDVGSYTGNNTDKRSVTGVGFNPDWAMVRADDTATARRGALAAGGGPFGYSQVFAAEGAQPDLVQDLTSDGFKVGTDTAVNASSPAYYYLALKNVGSNCGIEGTRYALSEGDSWVDQASPDTNNGSAITLKVQSKSSAQNARAFLKFSIPHLPQNCTVSAATMQVYNATPVSGRTIEAAQVSASWTEGGITWTNQPGVTGTAATATTPGAAGYMSWNVQSIVQSIYAGNNYGFRLKDQTEDNAAGAAQSLYSEEISPFINYILITTD